MCVRWSILAGEEFGRLVVIAQSAYTGLRIFVQCNQAFEAPTMASGRPDRVFSAMNKQLPPYVAFAMLFAACFLVLDSIYGYVIGFRAETNDCFFIFGRQFLLKFLDYPAGPLRYAGRFLGQFHHYQWMGALIVSASITGFGVLFYGVLLKLDKTAPMSRALLPCILLLGLHTSTLFLVYDTLGLCVSCGVFWGYLSLRARSARRVYALLAVPIAYFLVGVYAWVFVAWVVAIESLDGPPRRGLLFGVLCVFYGIAVPLAAWRWVYPISVCSAVVCPLIFVPPFRTSLAPDRSAVALDSILAVSLLVSVLLIPFWGRVCSGTQLAAFRRARGGRWSRHTLLIGLPVLVMLFHLVRYDAPLATVVTCRRLCKLEQWDAVLDRARSNPTSDLRLQFMMNLALCHKGRLLDEMFNHPQTWGTRGLVLNFAGTAPKDSARDDTDLAMYNSDLFYEMGHVNAAFRHAYAKWVAGGMTYDVLRRMAQCSMANGNHEMAAKYLNLLEKTSFHRDYARRYKAILADPNKVEREFRNLRSRMPAIDGNMFRQQAVSFLVLLEANPNNRMAFDYLTAWLLLNKKKNSIATICAGIGNFRSSGYSSIPTHCQEALLLKERAENVSVDLQGFRYDQATMARVDKFFQDLTPDWGRESARERARDRYGDTYMYYYFLVTTPSEVQQMLDMQGNFGGTSRQE